MVSSLGPLQGEGDLRSFRLRLDRRPADAPATVIAKVAAPEGERFQLSSQGYDSAAWAFLNESSAEALMTTAQLDPPMVPRWYASDSTSGIVFIEDVGGGDTVLELLRSTDTRRAEDAVVGLARALGRLHSESAARSAEYDDLRLSSGGRKTSAALRKDRVGRDLARINDTMTRIGFEWTPELFDEVRGVSSAMMDPGSFLALTQLDVCPGRTRLLDKNVVILDFHRSGFGNALLDAAVFRMSFPSSERAAALPPRLVDSAEALYRALLAVGFPAAADEELFRRGLVDACAYWLIDTFGRHLVAVLDFDHRWGEGTLRQRIVHRARAFITIARETRRLVAFAESVEMMLEELFRRWPTATGLPLFPAFEPVSSGQTEPG